MAGLISTKETVVGMKKEVSLGVAPTLGAADVFEVVGVAMAGKVENIDRTVLRAVLDDFSPMAGRKSTSGNVTVEPVGGGTANPMPQWGQMMEAAFGGRPIAASIAVTYGFLDDGGAFTDDSVDLNDVGADDAPLMPAVEDVNDAFYFGAASKFHGIRINLGIAGVGSTIVWEYWNGSSWAALTTARFYFDNTVGLTVVGTNDLEFDAPTDWALTTVNAQSAYWIRSRVTVASFTTIPVATQAWLRVRGKASTIQAGILAVGYAKADDGGVFTDEVTAANDAAANDITLLPAVESINDAYYFGHATRTFYGLRLNIGTAGVGTAIVWEYWNGTAWTDLSTAVNYADGTAGLTAAPGSHDLTFDPPTDWALKTVDSVSAYWLRLRCTVATFTTQPLGTQAWLLTHRTTSLTMITLGTGHGASYAVGMAIGAQVGTDDHVEARFITAITVDDVTVSPGFTVTPTAGKAVYPSVTWQPGAGLDAYVDSWTIQEWFADVFFQHLLCKCTGMDLNAPNVGAIPGIQFSYQGKEATSGSGNPPAFASTPSDPIIAMSCQLFKDGAAIDLTSLAVNLRNTATPRPSLRSTGMNDIAITRRRVEGSFNLFMEDKTFYDDYLAGTEFELLSQMGLTIGNIMATRCPKIRYTDLSIADEADAKRYSLNFRANPTVGNDSLYVAFL